jgi:3-phenylpropionate/cinnamic acid dioxygenase small subunit
VEKDDGGMSNLNQAMAAQAFIAFEADLLDHGAYQQWLDIWSQDGLYIIPIGDGDDFEDKLNYAYDDAPMRRMRVARLTSGQSMSANDAAKTVRVTGRYRLLSVADDATVTMRCAQTLTEYRREILRTYAANVTYVLKPFEDSFRIEKKIVRLINSDGALAGLTYLL